MKGVKQQNLSFFICHLSFVILQQLLLYSARVSIQVSKNRLGGGRLARQQAGGTPRPPNPGF